MSITTTLSDYQRQLILEALIDQRHSYLRAARDNARSNDLAQAEIFAEQADDLLQLSTHFISDDDSDIWF